MMEPAIIEPATPYKRLLNGVKKLLTPVGNPSETRLRRRRAIISSITSRLSWLISLLFFAGYLWMLIIPSPRLGRGTYIDENALQPGQVSTYWSWGDVHVADRYLEVLEMLRDTNATHEQRAQFIKTEFNKIGISAATQNYTFLAGTGKKGTNVYGVLYSPRTAGTEALVISASWLSRTHEGDGTLNLRGVSTVLALANFLKRYSLWAKDIVFVISDGYLDGMQAWLAAYHGSSQSNLQADILELSSGVIWTALNIDYPGHSFSHLGIFLEGLNGRLPNQDLLNSFQRIARYTGGVPVLVYDHVHPQEDPNRFPSWLSRFVYDEGVQEYVYQARNILRQFGYQARGRPSGVHGLFHQFRIDALTIFAVPATGPHGFHAIGRVVESTLRTANNLLERLHASFFFYVFSGPDRFLKIGSYLPSAILVSVALMFRGLRVWVDSAWVNNQSQVEKSGAGSTTSSQVKWLRRRRPVLDAVGIAITTHVVGALLFGLITRSWFVERQVLATPLVFTFSCLVPLLALLIPSRPTTNVGAVSDVLKAINLCFASAVISIITVLNFALAALLAILLGIPLSLSSAKGLLITRVARFIGFSVLGLGWLFLMDEVRMAIRDWEILSVWFAPFVCIIYVPLVLQAGLVCLLPS